MKRFYIPVETPAKKNSKIMNTKTHRMFPSKRYTEWHELASLLIRKELEKMIDSKCYIVLVFTHGDMRVRDSDNGVSSVFDCLKDCNVILDDCWQIIKNHHVYNSYEKGKPSCEIFIYKAEEIEKYKENNDILEGLNNVINYLSKMRKISKEHTNIIKHIYSSIFAILLNTRQLI